MTDLTPAQAAALKELPRITMFADTAMMYAELVALGYVEVQGSNKYGYSAELTPTGLAALREWEGKQ